MLCSDDEVDTGGEEVEGDESDDDKTDADEAEADNSDARGPVTVARAAASSYWRSTLLGECRPMSTPTMSGCFLDENAGYAAMCQQ